MKGAWDRNYHRCKGQCVCSIFVCAAKNLEECLLSCNVQCSACDMSTWKENGEKTSIILPTAALGKNKGH